MFIQFQCIARAAEGIAKIDISLIEASKNLTYYSSKFSSVIEIDPSHCEKERPPPCLFKHSAELRKMYRRMWLRRSPRYQNLYVNTSHSSVYVPTNLYDYTPSILHDINWTQQLDEVFRKNHRTFPSLSWQYFGSNTGILRHFPGEILILFLSIDVFYMFQFQHKNGNEIRISVSNHELNLLPFGLNM